jgi:hypothetical protein
MHFHLLHPSNGSRQRGIRVLIPFDRHSVLVDGRSIVPLGYLIFLI